MNKLDNCPNMEDRWENSHLPDELATLREDLQNLSGNELSVLLDRWKTLLFSDNSYISLMFPVFSEVIHKVSGITPMGDNLLCLNFLAQLKQALFSFDIFSYGEPLYEEYMEGIYRAAGSCSYYLKPAILQKYVSDEMEQYAEVGKILEEHYNGAIIEWMETDMEQRIDYLPSFEEIHYLTEQAQIFIRVDGNMDKALFFLYRAVILSLKRLTNLDGSVLIEENERLLNILLDMVTAYQLSSDEKHALEVLEYAQHIAESELALQSLAEQELLGQDSDTYENKTEDTIPDAYGELRRKILRKKGHVQRDLYFKKKNVTKEEVLSSYQEALSLSEAIFGTESSQAEEIKQDIARFRANSGEQGEIAVLLEKLKRAEEEMDTDTMESLHGMISEIYEESGDFDNAILHFHMKVNILIDEYGEDSDMAADYYNMLGELYERAGRYSEAQGYYEHALANYQAYLLRTQEEDADDPENILLNYEECLYHTGRMHLVMREYEEAILHFQEALTIYDSRCEYSGGERANYLNVLAETYEKMHFMRKACHYYLWAWDTYRTVAEFNQLRERNAALFEGETEECIKKEEQIRLHMQEIGFDRIFQPIEEIDYLALNKEERDYFLKRFGQLVRRRLKEEDIWKNWIFQWRVYHRIWMEWQQRAELDVSPVLEEAFSALRRYLNKDMNETEFVGFSEHFFAYLSDEDYDGDWEDDWEEEYMGFFDALEDFFHAILESSTDYRSFQGLICEKLPLWGEVFPSVYCKEDDYTEYEKELRYRQVVESSVFAGWIADIQRDIRLVLDCREMGELFED